MLELIAPVGTRESVIAAVQNRADAIYFAIAGKENTENENYFTTEDIEYATRYCRPRGCKVYAAINTLLADDELEAAAAMAQSAAELGVDGIIVQDIGFMRVLRRVTPDIPMIAGRRMGIENLTGAEAAVSLGASMVSLSRKLNEAQITEIAGRTKAGVIVSVFGPLCVAKLGDCYMSALLDGKPDNCGTCTQRCRRRYDLGGRKDTYPLCLKDNCLVTHLRKLEEIGVKAVQIEGREKRPEYTALATGIFARAIRDGIPPTAVEMEILDEILSEHGTSDGFFTGEAPKNMFGAPRQEKESISGLFGMDAASRVYASARKAYHTEEAHRVHITAYVVIRQGEPVMIGAEDPQGRRVAVSGPPPEIAATEALTAAAVEEVLSKTAGTTFYVSKVETAISPGVYVPPAGLRDMWRRLVTALSEKRMQLPARKQGAFPPMPMSGGFLGSPKLHFQVTQQMQLAPELMAFKPDTLYVPLKLFLDNHERALDFQRQGTEVVVVMPPGIQTGEGAKIRRRLRKAKELGISQVLLSSLGHVWMARAEGFAIRGDFGLGVYNSYTLKTLEELGFLSATASFELSMERAKRLMKPIDTEIIVYGRLPLMVTEHCMIYRSHGRHVCHNIHHLRDQAGALCPVMREFGCRNVVYSPYKLYLADRREEYETAGFCGVRLMFTTEKPWECAEIAKAYLGESSYRPNGITRGLYYKNGNMGRI